jgi:hypothetical protein
VIVKDRELAFEVGLGLVSAGILGALALLLGGRVRGDAQRRARHAQAPPPTGSVPAERHQHLSPSAR